MTSSKEKILYIFRHGETDWNRVGRFQGSTDIPLNENGKKQAEGLRRFFALNPVEAFMSSDLSRALETARIANRDLGVEIVTDRRLRETMLGKAEGMTRDQIKDELGVEVLEQWAEVFPPDLNYRFPGGESKAEHLARLLEGIEDLARRHPHTRWGIASHGGAIRRIIHHLRPDLRAPIMVANGVVYEMRLDLSKTDGLKLVDVEPRRFV